MVLKTFFLENRAEEGMDAIAAVARLLRSLGVSVGQDTIPINGN